MATEGLPGSVQVEEKLRFYAFQHPYVWTFVEQLQRAGISELLARANQRLHRDNPSHVDSSLGAVNIPGKKNNYFDHLYSPTDIVDKKYPLFNVDFDGTGAYSRYNWELFFHIPLFIATRLMQDQRHEDAMRWFHYIFNPMTDDPATVPQRYWNFKPFRDQGVPERIQDLLWALQDPNASTEKKTEVESAIREWREHPFEPHSVARGRPGAYMKTVLMKYIDNLVGWGDKLFRRDTIESINEATQLYILAANLLGVRPQQVPTPAEVKTEKLTYQVLRPKLDKFSNAALLAENLIVHSPFTIGGSGNGASNGSEGLYGLPNLAFCIPHNDTLFGYWDTVEDRLFKIRHCMNIEGVLRELPLFEPPIDPALLVRATAMGLDLSQVLDDLVAPLPRYRFTFMLQKAREFCEELKQLSSLLLSTLEKKDAEELGQIRARNEKDLLKTLLDVKKKQIDEAEETLAGLNEAQRSASVQIQFYLQTLGLTEHSAPGALPKLGAPVLNEHEQEQLDLLDEATNELGQAKWKESEATHHASMPDAAVGVSGHGPHVTATWGSSNIIAGIRGKASESNMAASLAQTRSGQAGILGSHIRRADSEGLQLARSVQEHEQIGKQIAAAEIRLEIFKKDLANHEKQIEQAEKIEEFLREKFTNRDLYTWMVSQVSAVYFQAYKLAYDLAKRAERVYRHELGITDSKFIQFGSWDNLRKGLLAGEKLSLDLRRLEHAYLEKNKREFEITKHISLRQLNPTKLLELKANGKTEVEIPEWLFDLDCPGHYMRRIKSVALSIPSIAGPYTSVNCTLSLLNSTVRRSTSVANGYERMTKEDSRFVDYYGTIETIVTSTAQNDSGLFETNLRDERLLPFEGAGAVSTWRLELPDPKKLPPLDYKAISDVILRFLYSARPGVNRAAVEEHVSELFKDKTNLMLLFSLRHDFPSQWSAFANGTKPFSATIRRDYFPYFVQGKTIEIKGFDLFDTKMLSRKVTETETSTTTSSKDLVGANQSFTLSASEDNEADPAKNVMVRDAVDVFLVISYTVK